MASVRIADLWTPQIWIRGIQERQATFPIIFNSGVVAENPFLTELASGGGLSGNVPFFKDITDQDDEVQVEATAPTNILGITAGLQVAPIMNRVTKNASEALAAAVSAADPIAAITGQMAQRRLKQRQKQLLAVLRGAFGTSPGAAIGVAAPLSPVRVHIVNSGVTTSETGVGSTALITVNDFISAKALMGELSGDLASGALFAHSNIIAALEKLDAASFKSGVQSGLGFGIRTYREIPVFVCDGLVRAGTTSGFVYDTYILSPGIIGYGAKPQQPDTIDVASLQFFQDKDKNTSIIWDRTRFCLHLNGLKWVGTPAGQSASNTELGTVGNWNLAVSSANRVGAVCIQSNG